MSTAARRIRGILLLFLIISMGYAAYSLSYFNPIHSTQTVRLRSHFSTYEPHVTKFEITTEFYDDGMVLTIGTNEDIAGFTHLVVVDNVTINLEQSQSRTYQIIFEHTDYFNEGIQFEIHYGDEVAIKGVWITRYNSLNYMIPHILLIFLFLGMVLFLRYLMQIRENRFGEELQQGKF